MMAYPCTGITKVVEIQVGFRGAAGSVSVPWEQAIRGTCPCAEGGMAIPHATSRGRESAIPNCRIVGKRDVQEYGLLQWGAIAAMSRRDQA